MLNCGNAPKKALLDAFILSKVFINVYVCCGKGHMGRLWGINQVQGIEAVLAILLKETYWHDSLITAPLSQHLSLPRLVNWLSDSARFVFSTPLVVKKTFTSEERFDARHNHQWPIIPVLKWLLWQTAHPVHLKPGHGLIHHRDMEREKGRKESERNDDFKVCRCA